MGRVALLLRHGATAWSSEKRLTSSTDLPLSAAGEAEARAAAVALISSRISVDLLITAPALRAQQTASIVAERLTPARSVVIDERLREVDFGRYEGKVPRGRTALGLSRALSAPRRRSAADPEPFAAAAARAVPVLNRGHRSGGVLLLVGHGYLTRVLIASVVLGLPLQNVVRLRLDTGRFAVVRWEGELPRLIAFNIDRFDGLEL